MRKRCSFLRQHTGRRAKCRCEALTQPTEAGGEKCIFQGRSESSRENRDVPPYGESPWRRRKEVSLTDGNASAWGPGAGLTRRAVNGPSGAGGRGWWGEAFQQGEQGRWRAVPWTSGAVRSQPDAFGGLAQGPWNEPRLSMAVRTVDKRERGRQGRRSTTRLWLVSPALCLTAAPHTPCVGAGRWLK